MRNSSTEKAYLHIRDRIMNREYRPGDFLPAQSLAKQIGVSRPTVKEALRHLELEELVVIQAKVGAFVRVLNLEEFEDMAGLRQAMEVHAAGQSAIRHQETDAIHLRTLIAEMNHLSRVLEENPDDLQPYIRLGEYDMRFHKSIVEISRNKFVQKRFEQAQIVENMTSAASHPLMPHWQLALTTLSEVQEEHSRICDAILARDKREAQVAMEDHLEKSAAKIRLWNLQAGRLSQTLGPLDSTLSHLSGSLE